MKSRFLRSLTVCFCSALTMIAAAGAADLGTYGSAPPSLDFPPSGLTDSEARMHATFEVKKNQEPEKVRAAQPARSASKTNRRGATKL